MKRIVSISLVLAFFGLFSFQAYSQNITDAKGKKQGSWSKANNKGNKVYEGNFKDDYEVGVFTYYYEDGKTVKAKSEFKDNGKFASTKMFNKEGNIISEGFYKNKKKDSLWTIYDEKGNKIGEERYVNGLKSGVANYWDKSKVLVETINYKNDKKDGIYYMNTYQNGYYYLTYKDDKKNGPYEDFYYYQKIKIKGTYQEGKQEGEWKYFDSIGTCVKIQKWQKDILISEKVRIDFGREEKYIDTKDIAYFYPTGKRLKVVLFNSEEISCINNIEDFLDVLGLNGFIQLNKKMMLYSSLNAIKGIGEKTGEDYIILLEPKPKAVVLTDKDSRKALESFFKK